MNRIVKYHIRKPGMVDRGTAKGKVEAKKTCNLANKLHGSGHMVFAEHEDKSITGPYYPNQGDF